MLTVAAVYSLVLSSDVASVLAPLVAELKRLRGDFDLILGLCERMLRGLCERMLRGLCERMLRGLCERMLRGLCERMLRGLRGLALFDERGGDCELTASASPADPGLVVRTEARDAGDRCDTCDTGEHCDFGEQCDLIGELCAARGLRL